MKRRKSRRKVLMLVLFIFLFLISVGYAYLSRTLKLNGSTALKKNSWSVKFTTITEVKNDGTIISAPTVTGDTTINFSEKLNTPGDEYIFKAKIENQGTIDAMLSGTPTLSGLEDMSSYLEYSVTYSDGVAIEAKNLLKAKSSDEITVTLRFKRDITENDLSSLATADVTKNMRLQMNYVQDDGTGVARVHRYPDSKVCTKAYNLHTETCSRTSSGCYATGYYSGGAKGTTTITYGHTDSTKLDNGTLKNGVSQGYALDCDVNGNGVVDTDTNGNSTERFYYVSDFYDTNTKSFNTDYATLIYYKNYGSSTVAYNSSGYNYQGPTTLLSSLPTSGSSGTWKNVSLKNEQRQILNESGGTTTSGGTLPKFSYTGYAARLLTTQEINAATRSTSRTSTGYLNNVEFLMEDSAYSKTSGCSGGSCYYWLETPYASYSGIVWSVYGNYRSVGNGNATNAGGSRPAVDILKSDISLQ